MSAPVTGQPIPRIDGALKVTGKATYAADNIRDNMVYAALVGSNVARGTVTGIDTAAAERHPGVLRIFTDFNRITLPFDPKQVASFDQPVAIVIGATSEAARHGATLVEVRCTATDHVTEISGPGTTPEPNTRTPDYSRGNPDEALRSAAVVSDLRYAIERNNHNAMELPATVAQWDGDRLTVWDKVQGLSTHQPMYADALGIRAEDVHIISPFVGGAFGSALKVWPHQLLTAFAAREMGRPVKLVLTRKQNYGVVGYRPTSRQRLAIGADRSGRIGSIIHEVSIETSRYAQYLENLTPYARFMYTSPNMRSTARIVPLDVNPACPMRGPGTVTGAYSMECAMDDLAHRLGLDPIELRRRNEPAANQEEGLPFSTRRLTECFEQGAAAFDWSRRNQVPRTTRDGNQLIGFGTAAAAYHTLRSNSAAVARANADGTIVVESGTIDMGPGTYTSMTQVAADALGIPMNRVRFALGDSRFPPAPLHGGSMTMASVGSAVHTAANMLRDRFIRTAVVDPASPLNGLAPNQVSVADGRMFATGEPSRGETYQDLLRRRNWNTLDSRQDWAPDDADDRYSLYAYGAVFAEVAVDELLGTVRIRRMHAVYDAGRIVNPKLAHSQAIGGLVGGIGMALLEGTHLDHRDGRIINANLADYLVPVHADIPALEAEFLPAEDTVANPLGVKGLAEVVIVGVPAAVANAVFNATGKRVTDLPITLDKLL
ncbi:xanthine dehydrogenase family protein molybdopterin-binding subunit [Mycolicibacterium goodii]|uniref:Acylaldehyde oxidase n=1 Tax=Mycolicibacterium goodii TaxID=134601 RepID=A0A0K0X8I3_MYCGD|nr:acylaldehyde oxidase [Mycolicibacterium goodii]